MGRLLYSMILSADGYVADSEGRFADWARPDEEVLEAVNEDTADVGTFLYGRRMYEMMAVWETDPAVQSQSPQSEEFARHWQSKEKIVYSTTLEDVDTKLTRLERDFTPKEVRAVKETAGHDLTVDGPSLAAEAFRHGLVDEVHMLVCPIVLGGGLRMLPDVRLNLRLRAERRFGNDMVQLKYTVD
ncbi:dihydrofolate reductase family protein [Nocardiopsis sp. NPDC007018]|uniref:dihydrofolate reductase family protein n=1 Tax=Nocardiopsis sp. NPDC007018 TaxID=3155721 RepID=UPI0033E40D8D